MESRQPAIWAASLITYFAALIAFGLRLVARRLKRLHLSLDDYLALIAFVFTTGFMAVNLYKIRFGFGLHLSDINGVTYDEAFYDYFRLLWIDSWFYTTAIGFSKLAVLAFFWRIFGQSSIKRPIQILFITVVTWLIVRMIIIPLQCIPIKKFWDRKIDGTCPIQTNIFFFATTFPHLLLEVVIVILPITKVRQLQLPRAQKIAVGCMFGSGTIVCVASLVQLIQAFRLDTSSQDLWWDGAPQLICAVIEVNLGHFSTSLPNLRPVLDIILGRRFTSSGRTGSSSRPIDRSIELSTKQNSVLPTSNKNSKYIMIKT